MASFPQFFFLLLKPTFGFCTLFLSSLQVFPHMLKVSHTPMGNKQNRPLTSTHSLSSGTGGLDRLSRLHPLVTPPYAATLMPVSLRARSLKAHKHGSKLLTPLNLSPTQQPIKKFSYFAFKSPAAAELFL
ncbi:hypothetical protein GOODEAATRI_012253 [Goodea atripinnis]|uniref:Secreted protein n=1 Tax=Goodea atripinnis TaxID=208336 RepID=A0ABV0MH76_9TELE